jgi:hypothetical protein
VSGKAYRSAWAVLMAEKGRGDRQMSPSKKKVAKKTAKKPSAKAKTAKSKKKAASKKQVKPAKTKAKKSAAKKTAKTAAKKAPVKTTAKKAAKAPAKKRAAAKAKTTTKSAAKKPAKKATKPPTKAATPASSAKTATKSAKGKVEGKVKKPTKRARAKKPVTPTGPRHPKLGYKWACFGCGAKFYDLGKDDPICPKCGIDQHEKPHADTKSSVEAPKPKVVRPMAQLLDDEEPTVSPEDEVRARNVVQTEKEIFDDAESASADQDLDETEDAEAATEPPEIDAV